MLVSWCERLIEWGIIFLIVFTPLAFGTVHLRPITLMELTVLLLTLIWLIKLAVQFKIVKTPLDFPLIIFLFLIVFQILPLPFSIIKRLSPNTYVLYTTYSGSLTWGFLSIYSHATKIEIFKFLTYVCVFLLVANNIKEKRQIEHLAIIIITVGFFMAILGIIQGISHKNVWFPQLTQAGHSFGPYVNKNHFAGYMEICIPLSLGFLTAYFTHFRKEHWRKLIEKEPQIAKFILLTFVTIILVGSLFFSLSRGGIVSFLLSMVFLLDLFLIRKENKGIKILIVFLTVSAIFLIWLGIDPIIARLSSLLTPYESIMPRGEVWEDSYQIIKDFPILGTGLGTYQYIFPKYKDKTGIGLYEHAHNDYVEYLSDTGILGSLLFFGSIIYFLIKCLKIWKQRHYPYVLGLCLGGIIGTVSILFHSFVDFNLHVPANISVLFIVLALTHNILHLGHPCFTDRRAEKTIVRYYSLNPKIKFILPVFFVVVLLLMSQILKIYRAEQYFTKVDLDHCESSVSLLHKAIKLVPDNAEYHYYLGKIYEKIGLKNTSINFLKLAKAEYQMAIKLKPTDAWYHLNLGWVYAKLGINLLAVKEIKLASKLDPKNPHIKEYIEGFKKYIPL